VAELQVRRLAEAARNRRSRTDSNVRIADASRMRRIAGKICLLKILPIEIFACYKGRIEGKARKHKCFRGTAIAFVQRSATSRFYKRRSAS
jgi:hypothetical protein